MSWKRLLSWGVLLMVIVYAAGSQPVAAQSAENAILQEVNNFRATLGLPPFTYNAQLAVAAAQQAQYIAETNTYTHSGYGGSTPQSRANAAGYTGRASENIVGGSRMTPPQALAWWRNSPPHYNTITSDFYTEIGSGFALGTLEQNIYTIVVGRPSNAPAPSVGSRASSTAPSLAAPIQAPPFNLAIPAEDGSITHEVRDGQALWTLAAYYDVEIDYILRINNMREGQFLRPGDAILVRLADGVPTPTPLPTPTPPFEHTVQRGQTLWTIAALHNLSVDELIYLNSLSANALVQPGDELIVRLRPGQSPPPTATPQLTHEIQRGQTLWEIALRYGLTLEEILAFNGITENALLSPGDVLFIRQPAAAEQAAAATPTVTATPTQVLDPTGAATPTADTAMAQSAINDSPTPQPTATPFSPSSSATATETPPVLETPTAESVAAAAPERVVVTDGAAGDATAQVEWLMLAGIGAAASGFVGLWLVLRKPKRRWE